MLNPLKLGIVGGRPNHAVYFYGIAGDMVVNLLYIFISADMYGIAGDMASILASPKIYCKI